MIRKKLRISNHFEAEPSVDLARRIRGHELLPPGPEGGFSAHKIWVAPNAFYERHTHPAPHLLVVLEGIGWGIIGEGDDEQRTALRPGDVFIVNPDEVHQVGGGDAGIMFLAVSFGSRPLTDPARLVLK